MPPLRLLVEMVEDGQRESSTVFAYQIRSVSLPDSLLYSVMSLSLQGLCIHVLCMIEVRTARLSSRMRT